ncbi:fumarylacetoacetate hydrolase family protein [Vibrio panuliri]|uniref:2-keto-4-pentenoate hydratase n=1 Tax=Vibrio panuliri TaxID=1381081 RepID=A0A1Q9HNH4_9VIBR|nr:fumarylacetoacetate hydrolase family protein [Vibrio panuliri]KAB1457718.1 fumarylacetoacetate hydrolase family protein [Vibrio panuliri]OLQ85798.1 2-keto-4-pentenoate hydratase [Vibrio panuliri]OLQ92351.1 2-keto-4-pentenoate hydratase [Vibrio panuliri]
MHSILVEDKPTQPSKVLCVGRNYLDHIAELNNAVPEQMVVFNKPSTAITNQLFAFHQETLHYEGEICFVVNNGKLSAVGIGLDLTKRSLQSKLKQQGLPWERAKAFDGSAVFSRFISLDNLNIDELEIELFINCVRVQRGGVKQMMYSPEVIINELKSYTTLCDGDVIMTGTPKGVGEVQQGDIFLGRLLHAGKTLIEIEWLAN